MKELLIKKRNREKDNLNNKDNTNNLINPYQTEIDSLKNDYKLVIE
jgi:hypothetical protein